MAVDINPMRGESGDAPERVHAARLLAAIVESSDDAIVSKSLDGVIQTWNAAAERMFGLTAAQAVGRHISIIIPADRLAEEQTIMARLMAGERIEHFETVRQRSDGQLVAVSLTISPIKDETGRIVAASKIARDVSARLRSVDRERALLAEAAATNARFRTLADNMSQFAWMADDRGWISWFNQRWFDYTGTTLEEMQGWGWTDVLHPDHLHRVVERLQHSWDTGTEWEDTFPLRGRDGAYRWFLSRAMPIRNEHGAIVRWFGTNTDVTEQRQLEEHLRTLTVELGEVNRRKDEFLATLSHELRTPLAAIRNAQAVLNVADGDPALVAPALATMNRQIAQMTRLLDDLLDVSRITRDNLQLRLARVDLATVLAHAVETCRPMFDRAGLDLTVDMPDVPVYLLADAARLAQVFGNLLTNAVKYTPSTGRVSLTTERQGSDVEVIVTDTGIGIPRDMLSRVFELFTQVDGQFERAQGGLGIGLSLVKRLVEMHGGTVTAHSDGRGTGSRFVVRLPMLPGVAVEPRTPDSSMEHPTVSRRILVVDDEPDSALTLAMLLQLRGHRADVAHDGAEALERAQALAPDVVLLDLGLPGMDGYEVCRRIREQPWGQAMVVVALTGWGQEEDRRRTSEAGFDLHLVKPIDPEELMRVLVTPPDRVRQGG